MKVDRLRVDSASRQSGHPFDFVFHTRNLYTSSDFVGTTFMSCVEWNTPVRYSEVTSSFGQNAAHPKTLFLTCLDLAQPYTWDSWSKVVSSTFCPLPGLVGTGFYGLGQDAPYVRRQMMGCVLQGDRLN